MRKSCLAFVAISLLVDLTLAQEGILKPPIMLEVDGLPEIPASLGEIVQRYQAASPDSLVGWDSTKIGPIFLRQASNVSRQNRRRAEYGDERDPGVRKFLESISLFRKADRVTKPWLVIQGKSDTRVVFSESEQMVAAVRKIGTPV